MGVDAQPVGRGLQESRDYTYPYDPKDGREEESAGRDVLRVLRGGSFYNSADAVRVGRRDRDIPRYRNNGRGFRVVVSPG